MTKRIEYFTNDFAQTFDLDSDTKNFKFPFEKMTQKFGLEFIEYLKCSYAVNISEHNKENMLTDDQFCELNGIPVKFLGRIKQNINEIEIKEL